MRESHNVSLRAVKDSVRVEDGSRGSKIVCLGQSAGPTLQPDGQTPEGTMRMCITLAPTRSRSPNC